MSLLSAIESAILAVRSRYERKPVTSIVLGSGLGDLADKIANPTIIDYADIPGFAESTALGHQGRLVCGEFAGRCVIAMQGRFHLYEGHTPQVAALPIRVLHALGARRLVVSNAAGGLDPSYQVGDVMVIDDHINLMFRNPLVGLNEPAYGTRFPDMSRPYDGKLIETALQESRRRGFACHRGVYVGMLGPTYETRAEYRMARQLGGDVVGMSTVPEVIVARQLQMRVFGVSVVTNACSPNQLGTTSGEEVIAAAAAASLRLRQLVEVVVAAD